MENVNLDIAALRQIQNAVNQILNQMILSCTICVQNQKVTVKTVAFTPRQFQLEGKEFESKMTKVFKGTEKGGKILLGLG